MPSLLMIDDEGPVCRSFARLLRARGIHVSAHTEPEPFMEEAATGVHDALLADLRLVGCEGTELFVQRRRAGDNRPFGIFSGQVNDMCGWELAGAANVDAYIPKSLEPDAFAAAVLALCAMRAPAVADPRNVLPPAAEGVAMCDIPMLASLIRQQSEPAADVLERLRDEVVRQAVADSNGNLSEASRRLGVPLRTLRRWTRSK